MASALIALKLALLTAMPVNAGSDRPSPRSIFPDRLSITTLGACSATELVPSGVRLRPPAMIVTGFSAVTEERLADAAAFKLTVGAEIAPAVWDRAPLVVLSAAVVSAMIEPPERLIDAAVRVTVSPAIVPPV